MSTPFSIAQAFLDRLAAADLKGIVALLHPTTQRTTVPIALRDKARKLTVSWGPLLSRSAVLSLPIVGPADVRTGGMQRVLGRLAKDPAFGSWLHEAPKEDFPCVFVTCQFARAQVAGFILIVENQVGWSALHPLPATLRPTKESTASSLPRATTLPELLALLGKKEFDAFCQQLPLPLSRYLGAPGVEAMWHMFESRFGAFKAVDVPRELASDPGFARCLFEHGSLRCRSEWQDGQLKNLAFELDS